MFGYIRPNKAELKIKDFVQYRAVYCGLCKTIKRRYGEIPRLSTNYDLTFMAVLLLAFHDQALSVRDERCIVDPIRKHSIAQEHEVLNFTAAVAVLLTAEKLRDNLDDKDHRLLSHGGLLLFRRAVAKAGSVYPDLHRVIYEGMHELRCLEKSRATAVGTESLTPPQRFGQMLADVFLIGSRMIGPDRTVSGVLPLVGRDLGQWIYYIDAMEDYEDDRKKAEYSALSELRHVEVKPYELTAYQQMVGFEYTRESSAAIAETEIVDEASFNVTETEIKIDFITEKEWLFMKASSQLHGLELAIDRSLALLDYKRFADVIANVICEGLYDVRMKVLKGQSLSRL